MTYPGKTDDEEATEAKGGEERDVGGGTEAGVTTEEVKTKAEAMQRQ